MPTCLHIQFTMAIDDLAVYEGQLVGARLLASIDARTGDAKLDVTVCRL